MSSTWWQRASKMHDRQVSESKNVMLTDHLIDVKENCTNLVGNLDSDFQLDLHFAIENSGLSLDCLRSTLIPVVLIPDMGKVEDNKALEIIHPVSGKHTTQLTNEYEKYRSESKTIH
jgi:hypothetical protein